MLFICCLPETDLIQEGIQDNTHLTEGGEVSQ